MVAIKDMEMPKDCKKCLLMGIDGKDILSPMMCIAIWATKHEIKHCVEGIILNDCPLVEIEERKVGKWIYDKASQNWRCSECNETPKTLGYVGTADFMAEHFRFCNHCGADMRGSEND